MYNSNFLKHGEILVNRYKIINILKQGGFGIVYKVKDLQKNKIVVIKEQFFIKHSYRNINGNIFNKKIQDGNISFKQLKEDVKSEIEYLKSIKHKNIVKAYDFFEKNNTIYSVMEYIEGMDLAEYLESHSFDEDEAKYLLQQLINGLKKLHKSRRVHRDIKPNNIMKTPKGLYKIIDFTTSKVFSNCETIVTGIRTPIYSPPELEKRRAVIGSFTDIYSLGIVLIRLFCDENRIPPLIDRLMSSDKSFQQLIVDLDISQKLKDVILKMTHLDPQKRFQNLEEIEDILFKKGIKMPYTEQMSRANPGCIIIMLDQSGSMEDPCGIEGETKKDLATRAVNRTIYEIIEASTEGENIKDRCFIGVIGYGTKNPKVDLILGGMVSDIYESKLRTEIIKRKVSDGAGGLIEIDEDFPIWVEPKAEWGTPMDMAFQRASELAQEWCNTHPDSFPPLVINISDGEPNDMDGAEKRAKELVEISNNDGNVLLLNAHIADGIKDPIKLPKDVNLLSDNFAKFLFNISSTLPEGLVTEAQKVGFNATIGAKGMVYNADADILIRLLSFGSSKATR